MFLRKKITSFALSAVLLWTPVFADDDPVVATYKGGEVRESQVMKQFKSIIEMQQGSKDKKFSELDPNLQEAIVRGYINVKLLEQEAKNEKLEDNADFQEKLTNVKNQMLQQELIDRKIKATINDKMIDDEYNNLVNNLKGKDELKVSHILVDSEKKAQDIYQELKKGAKFGTLAKKYSKDEGSKANSGDIGYIVKGQLVPEFENKAFSMKVGEVSPPVKTRFGWHIIKVLDKRAAQIPPKEQAKQNIVAKISREIVEKYFTELADNAEVKLNLPPRPAATTDKDAAPEVKPDADKEKSDSEKK